MVTWSRPEVKCLSHVFLWELSSSKAVDFHPIDLTSLSFSQEIRQPGETKAATHFKFSLALRVRWPSVFSLRLMGLVLFFWWSAPWSWGGGSFSPTKAMASHICPEPVIGWYPDWRLMQSRSITTVCMQLPSRTVFSVGVSVAAVKLHDQKSIREKSLFCL